MTFARPTVRRRLLAGLVPAVVLAASLTLMAPTCGTMAPGVKTFSRQSLIIPMDLCYQNTTDGISSNYPATGCTTKTNGDVIRAYGLVYQLIRNNIAVYWVIAPNKAATTDVDMTVQYNGGPAVLKYDWTGGGTVAGPADHLVNYRGGPFVVDGSDFARASAVLQAYKATFSVVNVHVANVAFQGYVAKALSGGWSAGGAVAPKLALLNIGSSGAGQKNAMPVIRGYLQRAGLDTAGAGGTTAAGAHGTIYDSLLMEDFAVTSGDWTNSNLYKNGYRVLWVPHWTAPSSCADCTDEHVDCSGRTGCVDPCPCTSKYPAATITSALTTIGAFSASGKDVFAECAGLGSFEGVFKGTFPTPTGYSSTYGGGLATTHFQTTGTTGFWINKWPGGGSDSARLWRGFSSPFMQIGDFPFRVQDGAINDYRPQGSSYTSDVVQFISDGTNTDYDVFTMVPANASHGSIVYLSGHSYSGTNGTYQVAGTRLVLNSLFNLGATCVESGVSCNTGELGECAAGVMSCDASGMPYCKRLHDPSPEVCDGKDNNCNGLVDEGLDTSCYDGPTGTQGVGICQAGVSSCVKKADGTYGMSACSGEVLPSAEVCNGLDDACTGHVDQVLVNGVWTALSDACYTGPSDTLDPVSGQPRGICKPGVATCQAGGVWGACAVCPPAAFQNPAAYPTCQILPQTQICGAGGEVGGVLQDMTCSGNIQCGCTTGATQSCYDGPAGTVGKGICHAGTRTCTANAWGECNGEQTPQPKDCTSPNDNDCNGIPDNLEPECNTCPPTTDPSRQCLVPNVPRNPDGTPMGVCKDGVRACTDNVLGACEGVVLPSPELCDAKDNNCDGQVDENPDTLCGPNFTCVSGVCVRSSCGVEASCLADGFVCDLGTGKCVRDDCPHGSGTWCAAGQTCEAGQCVDPCANVVCGEGATCASGACTGGGCYVTGCDTGKVCVGGSCVTDPCGSSSCPAGTFCRGGDCVQSCVYVKCPAGQICSFDGYCQPDLCAGLTCEAGKKCVGGSCVDNPCAGLGCGGGQTCVDGVCEDDPCNVVSCPVGACSGGQCYPVMKPDTSKPTTTSSSSGGCSSGGGASPLAALLVLALLSLARRCRPFRPGRGGAALTVLGLGVLLAGSACQKKSNSTVDLSSCTYTCPGENRCVDLNFESAHCGRCDTVCGAGQICEDGVCGPSTTSAPFIATLSPAQGTHGALLPITVTVTGQRFQDGADVRVNSLTGSTTYPATFVDAQHLTTTIDLLEVPVTELAVRVVNPDRVISNAADFSVTTESPVLSSVDPPIILAGAARSVIVHGTGFNNTSLCHSNDATGTDTGLVTVRNTDGTLTCWFDTTSLPPGDYPLWVVNDGVTESNRLGVTVQSATPVIAAVTPSAAQNGTIQDITITGTGFDVTAVVYFNWSGSGGCAAGTSVPTSYVGPTQLTVAQYAMPATDGTAHVSVKTSGGGGGGCSNADKILVSQGSPPKVSNLSVTPSPVYQGDTATLSFSGSSFPTAGTASITITPPSGATFTTGAVAVTATTASGSASLVGKPDGLYSAYLTFGNGITSGSFPFRVMSNTAVLQSATPGGGQAGSTPSVTLAATNVRGTTATVKVNFTGSASQLTPTSVSATQVVVPVPLVGIDTGVYQLSIQNPNATASNQVSFSVSPGAPTLTGLSPACVAQSDTAASITLTGTNFAKSSSGAVTQVEYSADGTTFYAAPVTVTVTNPTTATAALDTRQAYVDPTAGFSTYSVRVWNPSTSGKLTSPAPYKTLKVTNGTVACP